MERFWKALLAWIWPGPYLKRSPLAVDLFADAAPGCLSTRGKGVSWTEYGKTKEKCHPFWLTSIDCEDIGYRRLHCGRPDPVNVNDSKPKDLPERSKSARFSTCQCLLIRQGLIWLEVECQPDKQKLPCDTSNSYAILVTITRSTYRFIWYSVLTLDNPMDFRLRCAKSKQKRTRPVCSHRHPLITTFTKGNYPSFMMQHVWARGEQATSKIAVLCSAIDEHTYLRCQPLKFVEQRTSKNYGSYSSNVWHISSSRTSSTREGSITTTSHLESEIRLSQYKQRQAIGCWDPDLSLNATDNIRRKKVIARSKEEKEEERCF